jgi:ABC-type multidrug transport system fused ATPase/permease subunit
MIRISEKVLISMAVIGLILKGFFFEPAGGFLMFMALLCLSVVYGLLGWRLFRIELNRSEKRPQFFYAKLSALLLTASIWAFLIKVFTLPYEGWFWLIVVNSGFITFFILFKILKLDYQAHRFLMLRMIVAFLICFTTMFISSHSIIRFFYRYDKELVEYYINAFDDPGNEQFHLQFKQRKYDEAQRRIQEDRRVKKKDSL